MKKVVLILVGFFVVSLALQGLVWNERDIIDGDTWAEEAQFLQTGDPRAFEGGAYGYPGSVPIDGTIIVREITGLSYYDSLFLFLTVFNSLVIALICLIAYKLTNAYWWPIVILFSLALAPLYQHATPTTTLTSIIGSLLCILTLYLVRKGVNRPLLILWGITIGLLMSVRIDMGGLLSFLFVLVLCKEIGWRKLVSPLILSVIIFALLDPFLWIMPAKHIADMIYRITFHYFEYQGPNLSHSLTFHLSIVAIVSVLLALISIFDKRRESSAPRLFVLGLTTLSIFWYAVFLTSHSQALRYFQPIIMIWEMLLGLFLFNMLSQVEFKFLHSEQAKNRAQTIVFVMATFIVSLRAILIFGAWYMQ